MGTLSTTILPSIVLAVLQRISGEAMHLQVQMAWLIEQEEIADGLSDFGS